MKTFENICKMSQKELKTHLTKCLENKYNDVVSSDGYIYAKGTFPVLLVAHMDTVHHTPVKHIVYSDDGNKISSPQGIGGDDRCGAHMVMEIIKSYNCSVLFTEDEEKGCIGARKFVKDLKDNKIELAKVNYMIELDRKGSNDAVFYECDNPDFEDFILAEKDWKFDYGSFTDIVELEPAIGVAGVNLSCGYYNAHTTNEYVILSEMYENINKAKRLLERTDVNVEFEYIEAENDWYDSYGFAQSNDHSYAYNYEDKAYYIAACTKNGKYVESEMYAISEAEAVGWFLINHPNICYNDITDIICEE